METLTLAFLGHLVGDYLLQTDWMAENKKYKTMPCLLHSALWAGSVVFFTGWGFLPFVLLLVAHFIQDRTYLIRDWMHLMGQDRFATGSYSPWGMVIVDNTLHLLQIWLIWKFIV